MLELGGVFGGCGGGGNQASASPISYLEGSLRFPSDSSPFVARMLEDDPDKAPGSPLYSAAALSGSWFKIHARTLKGPYKT